MNYDKIYFQFQVRMYWYFQFKVPSDNGSLRQIERNITDTKPANRTASFHYHQEINRFKEEIKQLLIQINDNNRYSF